MDRKYKKVAYVEGHTVKDGLLIPVIKNEEIMLTSTKRFHNCLYLILGLSKAERLLMDWISEEMDDKNMIRNDEYSRKAFISCLEKIVSEGKPLTYTQQSVNTAFKGLCDAGLLRRYSKSVYQVDAMYYWKGDEKERINTIMMNIQFNTTEANFKVLKGTDRVYTKKNGKEVRL